MTDEADLHHGVPVYRGVGGAVVAGPVYCPIYMVESDPRDHVMIDDEAFVSTTSDIEAAKIALMRQVDTTISGLIWNLKIGVVSLTGLLSRKGRVGPFDVLFFRGPTFDLGRQSDDQLSAARRAAGMPTGLPGDRKLIVPVPSSGKPGYRILE